MGELTETDLHEYLQVRHTKIVPSPSTSPDPSSSSPKLSAGSSSSLTPVLPSKFYKVRVDQLKLDLWVDNNYKSNCQCSQLYFH